jgi:hypothetical protein
MSSNQNLASINSWRLPARPLHKKHTKTKRSRITITPSQFAPNTLKTLLMNQEKKLSTNTSKEEIIGHPRDPWHLEPKQKAISFRNWKLLHLLLEKETAIPTHILHDAILHGAPLKTLKDLVIKLDKTSQWGESLDGASNNPLHSAILCHQWQKKSDQEDTIIMLLNTFPAACLHKNVNGQLPLHLAADRGNMPRMCKLMCETRPMTCRVKDNGGHTPLHLAATMNNFETVSVLVDADPSVASIRDRRGDLPIALLASNCVKSISCENRKIALKKLRDAYSIGLHKTDRRNKTPLDYVIDAGQGYHDEVKILTPKIFIETKKTKINFKKILYSKFHAEDTILNFNKLLQEYHYIPPVIDTMFHSRPWTRTINCAKVPIRKVPKSPHRPTTPVIHRTFTWYAKDSAHLTGRDFNGENRHFDKVVKKPSPRLRRLVKIDKTGCGRKNKKKQKSVL